MNVIMTHLEKAAVTLLPVAALLLLGWLALPHLDPHTTRAFLLLLSLSSCTVFFGEHALLFWQQRHRQRQYQALVDACQGCLIGDTDQRPHMQGNPALLPLARLLNTLLDTIMLAQKHSQQQQGAILRHQQQQAELRTQCQQAQSAQTTLTTHLQHAQQAQATLTTQLQQLIRALQPVLQGDLRVRAELPPGEVGMLADVCNALIEEVSRLVRWMRSLSQQLTIQTRTLLTYAVALAQQMENHLLSVAQTTETAEQLATSLQQLHDTLHLTLERIYTIPPSFHMPGYPSFDFLSPWEQEANEHVPLLTEVTQMTGTHLALAQTVIGEGAPCATGLHHAGIGVLQTAELLTTLTWLAQQWEEEVRAFQLAEPPKPSSPAPTPRASPPPALEAGPMPASPEPGSLLAHVL